MHNSGVGQSLVRRIFYQSGSFLVLSTTIASFLVAVNLSGAWTASFDPQQVLQHMMTATHSCLIYTPSPSPSPSPSAPQASSDPSPPLPVESCTHKGNSSCCLDCDIAELKIVDGGANLFGCPQLKYKVEASTLAQISGFNDASNGVWIAMVADSVLLNVYTQFPVTILGSNWWSGIRGFNITWYRNDQVFCCADRRDVSSCMYGRRGFEFDVRVGEYVQQFLSSHGEHSFCSSFVFATTTDECQRIIGEHMKHKIIPYMVTINPGLHIIATKRSPEWYRNSMRELFGNITTWQRQRRQVSPSGAKLTTFIIYMTTLVNDTLVGEVPLRNDIVLSYNKALINLLDQMRDTLIESRVRVIDNYRLSAMGDVVQLPDGIHYYGNFLRIVNFLQINFLINEELTGFCSGPLS